MQSNAQLGKGFEQELISILAQMGFWVHPLHPAPDGGQPFDVIAAKNGECLAFECKVVQSRRFPLSRVEDNQITAITRFAECGNEWQCFFAFKRGDGTIWFTRAMEVLKYRALAFGASPRAAWAASIEAGNVPISEWGQGYGSPNQQQDNDK